MHDAEERAVGCAALVGVVQRRRDRVRDLHGVIDREPFADAPGALDRGVEVLAVDVLHREEVRVVDLAEIVDMRDVRVIERGGEPRLVEEQPHELRILGELRQDLLEHDELLEALGPDGAREKQLGHPTSRQLAQDLVRAQAQSLGSLTGGRPH